jgi:hypothetical protein
MTRYEIRIEELVLHGVPRRIAAGIGPLVQQRLAALGAEAPTGAPAAGTGPAGTAPAGGPVRDGADLADRIARAVWQQIGGAP